ncbi:hypothetical protein [Sphingobacterium multivorum]|uniref:hypothetical protein n=1 Tax=Sphingobacterium multivorum TaxID=28454 RepID=UPI0028AA8CC0|nr:hypothetical protein [Sphingobacterium multivorum]
MVRNFLAEVMNILVATPSILMLFIVYLQLFYIFAIMLRKNLAIVFFFIAQVVILGHGTISHHHHENSTVHSHQEHDTHKGCVDLEALFSGIQHTGEQITFTNDRTDISVAKELSQPFNAVILDYQYPIEYIVAYQQHAFPPDRHIIYQSQLYGTYSLRGPPSFIVA